MGMPISSERKKDLLLQSFDVLKNNLDENKDKICDLIAKVAKIDTSIAIEMWNYILDNGKQLVKDSDKAYHLCGGLIYALEKQIGGNNVIEILKENPKITEVVFGESGDICSSTESAISSIIRTGDFELADTTLSLVYKNKRKEKSFGEILEYICEISFYDSDNDEELNQSKAELLLNWAEKIKDKERKARIDVTLSDYI